MYACLMNNLTVITYLLDFKQDINQQECVRVCCFSVATKATPLRTTPW